MKEKLKQPSKRVNGGQLHRLKHDILVRSYETRQFALARKIVFVSDSIYTETKQKKMSKENIINVKMRVFQKKLISKE